MRQRQEHLYENQQLKMHFLFPYGAHATNDKMIGTQEKERQLQKNWGNAYFGEACLTKERILEEIQSRKFVHIVIRWATDHSLFQHIRKADFSSIISLNLPFNRLLNCEFLTSLNTPQLQALDLSMNFLTKIGCLAKVDMRSLKKLDLKGNYFIEMERLSQMNSPKLDLFEFEQSQRHENFYPVVPMIDWLFKLEWKNENREWRNAYDNQKRVKQEKKSEMLENHFVQKRSIFLQKRK